MATVREEMEAHRFTNTRTIVQRLASRAKIRVPLNPAAHPRDACTRAGVASGRRPGPELLGGEYCPDVRDPVACYVEGQHCRGDAVSLSDQAGLAVDPALQDREAGCPVGEIDAGARDLLSALDRLNDGAGQAGAVGDHH